MQIIPVIDIRDGLVVHATGGNRHAYPALTSVLTQSVLPTTVLKDLLTWAPFQQIYIADLDAIATGNRDCALYTQLAKVAGDTELWLDAGFTTGQDVEALSLAQNSHAVLGSETLDGVPWRHHQRLASKVILSLDYKQQQFLGPPDLLQPTSWPERLIVMNLDHVGADNGPDIDQLKALMALRPDCDWYAAGGVRNIDDIMALENAGASGVLIASALHRGKIDKQAIARLLAKK